MLLATMGLKAPDGTIGPNGTTSQLPRVQVLRRTPLQIFFTNTLMITFRGKAFADLFSCQHLLNDVFLVKNQWLYHRQNLDLFCENLKPLDRSIMGRKIDTALHAPFDGVDLSCYETGQVGDPGANSGLFRSRPSRPHRLDLKSTHTHTHLHLMLHTYSPHKHTHTATNLTI